MTDKPTPTDTELKAMWQIHAADIGGIFYYARAVLAKWGQPAQAAEPVAVVVPCYTPSGKRVALCSAKQDLPIGTNLYAAPQPSYTAQAADSVPAVEREQERIAFKDAHRHLDLDEVPDAWGRPMFKHSHVEASWLGWIARASRGKAPAGGGGQSFLSMKMGDMPSTRTRREILHGTVLGTLNSASLPPQRSPD